MYATKELLWESWIFMPHSVKTKISLYGADREIWLAFSFFFYKKLKHVCYQKENQSQKITFLHQKYTEMHGLTRESHAALKRKKTLFISLANICQTARLAQHPFKDDPFSQQITQLKAEWQQTVYLNTNQNHSKQVHAWVSFCVFLSIIQSFQLEQ